jgi:hypothetical protein
MVVAVAAPTLAVLLQAVWVVQGAAVRVTLALLLVVPHRAQAQATQAARAATLRLIQVTRLVAVGALAR